MAPATSRSKKRMTSSRESDALTPESRSEQPLTYKSAGVDIAAGNALVDRIKSATAKTRRPEVMGGLGGFGALCKIPAGYREPVLVAGTDGVGTKLKLALQTGLHHGVGIDLVAMCVNDLIVAGAEPLFFLDYYATAALDLDTATAVIEGIAAGCELAGAALIGGETAEMPGMYQPGDYDLAGFCVGVAEQSEIIDGSKTRVGDAVIAMASSGPHSNGYSLVRKIIEVSGADLAAPLPGSDDARPLAEVLMEPTRIYVRALQALFTDCQVNAIAHITGGGLLENIPRVLPDHCGVSLRRDSWELPPVFRWLQQAGRVEDEEMHRTFNCGVGMVVVVPPAQCERALRVLNDNGEQAWLLGEVTDAGAGEPAVTIA